jgi:alpha-galactosidase
MMKRAMTILLFLIISAGLSAQKFKGLALTPPMGWNSWNHFACNINEEIIRGVADEMAANGMKDAGYLYINIDDCWHGGRDSLGFIQANPERFPSGMKALSDYVHSKGLKLGIYSDAGWKTCGGHPGSRGHEYQDAMKYAEWGIDYLKYDWCNTDALNAEGAYLTMRDAIYAAGRPIVFSICEWGNNNPWEWGGKIGHLWRTTGDINNCFDCENNHGTWSSWGVLQIIDMRNNDTLRKYAGPDHWNDPDMMEVGNGMSVNEDRAHFTMWCMLAAPLIAGNDLRHMSRETLEILTNKEVISIDQDKLGIQGFVYKKLNNVEVWVKPLEGSGLAVCFLNRDQTPQNIEFDWKAYPVDDGLSQLHIDFNKTTYQIRDLWAKKAAGTTDQKFKAAVPGHDVIMLRLYQ